MGIRVGLISLGCPKNRVDSEMILQGSITRFEIIDEIDYADIIIINTAPLLRTLERGYREHS